jgi:serine/threonine-protein kinase
MPAGADGATGADASDGHDAAGEGLPCRFGRYTLLRRLATGGMAELFLALHKSVAGFEKLVVIKRILPAMNQDRAFIEMLLHEARIAATLSHPNIVQVFDVGTVDDTYFIAMEHVHGEDLRSIVRQMKKKDVTEFPIEHALSIVLGMCAGLAYAHDKRDLDGTALNIVHRDVSPQNVVVSYNGDVRVVDFGIAKSDVRVEDERGGKGGRLKGKVPYMSPEQARGEAVDWRSDIFAVGVVLFELTTGKRLFKGKTELETLRLICDQDYPLPSQVSPGYPRELEAIVMRALAKDRTQRWQSARDMQAALEAFVRKQQLAVSPIALASFMQHLFAEKLTRQKEALLQGKQLADVITVETGVESMGSIDTRSAVSSRSTVGSTRTLTDAPVHASRSGWMTTAAGFAAAVAVGGALLWWTGKSFVARVTPPVGQRTTHGVIAIATDPPGATIFVNGQARAETTPATLPRLALGAPYELRLVKEGFEDARQTVTLTELDPSGAVSVVLQHATPGGDAAALPVTAH